MVSVKCLRKIQGVEEVLLFYRTTHSPRTTLLNAMRFLATNADFESREVYALSIHTLADALAELGAAESAHAELRRRSPRVRVPILVLLVWEENQQEHREHTFTVTVSRFGCALHSHRFLEPETAVRLEHDGKTIGGRVVYSIKDHSIELVEVGLGFDQDGLEFWGTAASID